ncbi:MAG: acetyl-CoA hydrolase/transferase C-terminal domain-containing protein, partial [Chloroflexota bacterium]
MEQWREHYQRRMVTAEEAAKVVASGNRVAITAGREPLAIGLALAARLGELKGVELFVPTPTFDFGWFDAGWEDSFNLSVGYVFPRGVATEAMRERRCDYVVGGLRLWWEFPQTREVDVLLAEVSPPDSHGFCSFGASLYDKRSWARGARVVLAEVNDRLIRTRGDNFIHVSGIDYFVQHPRTGREPGQVDQAGRPLGEAPPHARPIAELVSTLVQDGDTVQIGTGGTAESLVRAGLLHSRQDIGWHSEVTPGGIIRLVREGVITGKKKTIDRGKAVATAIGGGSREDMDFVNDNPLFELRDVEYTHDPRVISSLDNLVAINNALAVDLTGQVAAESIGSQVYSGGGGLLAFATGAALSRGGRLVVTLPATYQGGKVSTIVPCFLTGTVVTVPRTLADIVVTE